jgi:hypothetical protein
MLVIKRIRTKTVGQPLKVHQSIPVLRHCLETQHYPLLALEILFRPNSAAKNHLIVATLLEQTILTTPPIRQTINYIRL